MSAAHTRVAAPYSSIWRARERYGPTAIVQQAVGQLLRQHMLRQTPASREDWLAKSHASPETRFVDPWPTARPPLRPSLPRAGSAESVRRRANIEELARG